MIPDLNPETVCWETFGFPDPTFIPAGYGLFALRLALTERQIFYSWPDDDWNEFFAGLISGEVPYIPSSFRGLYKLGKLPYYHECLMVDQTISLTCGHYLHPDRREDYLRGTISKDGAVWTFEELMTAAAGGDASAVIHMSQFSPEYYAPWLIQRRNAIDLLRYVAYKSNYYSEVVTGASESNVTFPTIEAAITSVMENSWTSPESYSYTDPALEYFYRDPSWGDRSGYYQVRFQQLNRVYCEIPRGITNWVGFMGADFYIPEGCLPPPNYPGAGYSRIVSDGNGNFLNSAPFPFWTGTTLPTGQSVRYDLAIAGYARIYFDLYPQFRFKAVEETETP